MAELTKKLHMINSSGTAQTAKIYSTTAEVGPHWLFTNVDGIPAYVPIGDINDFRATSGRVKGSSGDTYAILNTAKPAYNAVWFTEAGIFTFTVPAGVSNVLITGCGGGAGGLTVAHYNRRGEAGLSGTAGSGGNSSFGSFSIQGGRGATCADINFDFSDDFSTGLFKLLGTYSQGAVAEPNGRVGGIRAGISIDFDIAGATGFALGFDGSDGTYGQGGNTHHYYDSDGTTAHVGAGGNSGAYVSRQNVAVTPNSTVTVIVSAGGACCVNSTDGEAWRYTATDGTHGFICVEYGGDI